MSDSIYFIPTNDKPIKLMFNNQEDIKTKTENYKLSLKEVLKQELREVWINSKITGQQYKSEKGKIKVGLYNEIINFLGKKGITKEYIDKEVNQERQRIIITRLLNIPITAISNNKFGIISYDRN